MKTTSLVAFLSVAFSCASSARGQTLEWIEQLGTSSAESSRGVSADGLGNVYISGSTSGSLGGPHAGEGDVFLSKYDAGGTLQWTEQLGTSEFEQNYGVSADGLGNVYISGLTRGSLGGANAGSNDAFLTKYDASGTFRWTEQLGTSESDFSLGVSADGLGSVYISGGTTGSLGGPNAGSNDAFLAKFGMVVLGDMNCDGGVDFDDIDALVLALLDPSDYEATYGVPPESRGDIDGDGDNDYDDIDGFVVILNPHPGSAGTQTIPEPGTALLLGVAGLVLCGLRRRTRRMALLACPAVRNNRFPIAKYS